ncbi:MAG: type II secretion system protein [Rhodocyclaceae bacterium]|nr:type II secretion system protein [Rhodocyclaceae bacterium]
MGPKCGSAFRPTCGPEGRPTNAWGFSLIELLAVLVILSVLAAAAMPLASLAAKHIKEQELRYDLRQMREAMDAYKRAGDEGRILRKVGESGYPKRLEALAEGVEDTRDPNKAKIYFLRDIPTDPFAPEGVMGAESWVKRSYASSAKEPREGEDVFDVHSGSKEVGLNGIPYDKW